MAHWGALEGLRTHRVRGQAERADVGGQVGQAQRRGQVAEVREHLLAVRPGVHLAQLLRGEAGGDEVGGAPLVADGRDHAVAGRGQDAGAVDGLLQDRVEVEAGADAQDSRAQRGHAVLQNLVPSLQVGGIPFYFH